MKKTSLTVASALLGVLLISGMAQAAEKAMTKAPTPATTQMVKGEMAPGDECCPKHKAMHETMMKVKEENKGLLEEVQAKRKELQEIIKAPTFDKSAYLAKHEELQALREKLGKARAEAMADSFEKMTSEERSAMPMMREHGDMQCKGMMGHGGKMKKGGMSGHKMGGMKGPEAGKSETPAAE